MNRDEEGVQVLRHYAEVAPKGKELDAALKMIEEPRRAREVVRARFQLHQQAGGTDLARGSEGKDGGPRFLGHLVQAVPHGDARARET